MNSLMILFAWNLGLLFPIALAAWLLCQFSFFKLRPALRHGIWLLVLLKFLTPPMIPIPVFPGPAQADGNDPPNINGRAEFGLGGNAERLPRAITGLPNPARLPSSDEALSFPDPSPQAPVQEHPAWTMTAWQWIPLLLFVLSVVVTFALWAAAWRQLKRLQQLLRSGCDSSADTATLLEEIARRFRFRAAVGLCLVESEVSPMMWARPGKPVIVLPHKLLKQLNREQLQLVLAHELAHYQRRDHWFNLFAFFASSLFWWHPVAWFARREMIQAAESACDAKVLARFQGARRSYAETLLKVVDFMTSRSSAQTGWVSQFGGVSPLGRRIEMIANATVQAGIPKGGWPLLLAVALTFSLLPVRGRDEPTPNVVPPSPAIQAEAPATPSASGPFFVQGSVIEEDTRRPIANASLNFFVDGEDDQKKRALKTSTDAKGQFRLEVPVGVIQLWDPELKPGYWLPPDKAMQSLNTSVEQPVATLVIEAKRGAVWPIEIKTDRPVAETMKLVAFLSEEPDDIRRTKIVHREETESSLTVFPSLHAVVGRDGKGFLTQCGTSGKFYLAVGDLEFTGQEPPKLEPITTELLADPAFDPAKVKTVTSVAGTDRVELVDETGKKARIGKAVVSLEGAQACLTFHLKQSEQKEPNKTGYHEFFGKVVDSRGEPLADVQVQGNWIGESFSGEIPGAVKTDQAGLYRFRLPAVLTGSNAKESLSLLFRKEGYSSGSSRATSLHKTPQNAIDAGTHTLQLGHSMSFVVVDQRGKPIVGALATVSGDRMADWLTLRTDAAGRCMLRSLPAGLAQIHITNGKSHADYSVVVSPIAAENTELTFRFNPPPLPEPSFKIPTPLEIGKPAPEWDLEAWSDGKKRTLADFRGKWVVLHFWSMAWNPSVRRIPFCQAVADQKQLADVVFLAMHTPGGDPVQIQRLQKSTGWKALCAIDRGTTLFDGETAKRYGARNPGTFIINPEGKIVFNDVYKELTPSQVADQERESKELAASMNIPWPLTHRDDEASEALENRFYSAQFGRDIEKLMRGK